MRYWIFMTFCNVLIPLVMIIGGYMMRKHPPKKINGFVGYRTRRSRKSKETWDYAHALAGRIWWKIGWIMILPSEIAMLAVMHGSQDVIDKMTLIVDGIQVIILLGSIFFVEKGLKENFDEEGRRIQ